MADGKRGGPEVVGTARDAQLPPMMLLGIGCLAVLVAAVPLVDLTLQAWPPRPTTLSWRYGTLGLGASQLTGPVCGLAIGITLAWWRRSPSALGILGWLGVAASLLMLLAAVLFFFEAMEVTALAPDERRRPLRIAAVVGALKYIAWGGTSAVLGWGALRFRRPIVSDESRAYDDPAAMVIPARRRDEA